jgi:simple sugar transport system permease protein
MSNHPATAKKSGADFLRSPAVWPLAGIVFLIAVNLIMDPAFLRISIFDGHLFGVPIDILNQGSRIMILALGMTLVIATGGIDLSVGSVVAISGSVAAMMITQGTDSLPLILVCSIAAGAAIGLANGVLVAFTGVQPIVATLIFMVAGRGIAQLITNGEVLIIKHPSFEFLGNGFLLALPFAALIAGALYLATHFSLQKTSGRLYVEAVGDNPTASRFVGIPTTRVKCLAYVFCGACAGVAGVLAAANIRAADPYRAGENMELDAIFAVVVGGTALSGGRFLLLGSFFGALLLQTLTITMYNVGVPPAVATVPKALLILFVCVFQSDRVGRWIKSITRRKAAA